MTELDWHYGPTDSDPDPGSMWHRDCGGQVWFVDGVYCCGKCGQEDVRDEGGKVAERGEASVADPHALIDAYAQEFGVTRGARELAAPRAFAALRAVLARHKPYAPPPGKQWVSGGTEPHCEGCSNGDPFDDEPWPCPTVQDITKALEKR